jgi:outer membrane receptor protein involved in Fe transport
MSSHFKIALLASVALTAPLAAQEGGQASEEEEAVTDVITVTSRFREESVQDIGASIAGITGEEMLLRGIQDIEDLSRNVPGMQNVKTRPNSNDIAIRGVRSAGSGYESSTVFSVFLDDVSVTGSGNIRDFSSADLNRVEVIRGPQPTLFGEGAVGGVIRYFTNDPDLDGPAITGQANVRAESIEDGGLAYTVDNATSFVMVPGQLGLRVSGFQREDDGFIDNPSDGEDVNDFESVGGRVVLLARPTVNLEFRLSAFLSRDEMGESTQVDPGSDPEDLTFAASPLSGSYTDDFDLYSGRVSYDFDWLQLTSITGYYERNTTSALFSAGNSFGLAPFFPTVDTTSFSTGSGEFEQWSQEFRFVSFLDGPLNFTAGAYFRNRSEVSGQFLTCADCVSVTTPASENLATRLSETESEQYSAFAEFTYEVTDRLRLIGGARYVNDTVTATLLQDNVVNLVPQFDSSGNLIPWTESNPIGFVSTLAVLQGAGVGTEFNFELEEILPRAGVEYELSDSVLLYANVARGARNGGIGNAIAALGASGGNQDVFLDNLTFDEDSVLSIDGGVKATWMGGDLVTNVGIFRTTYDDTQIWVNTPANNTVNGPEQSITGLELESSFQVTGNLSTFLNLSFIDAEFDKGTVITAAPGGSVGPFDLQAGNSPANIPEFTMSAGYSYSRPIGSNGWTLVSNGSFQYIGERYSDVQNFPSAQLEPLENLNLSVELSNDVWSIGLFGTNLLNDIEAVSVGSNPLQQFINADGELDAPIIATSVNRPRTIGVRASLRY